VLNWERLSNNNVLAQNENMFGALRLVTVQKGLDPCDFALVPFGGAGPHGNAMAMLGAIRSSCRRRPAFYRP
jgi:N-methylhydantoinase A/oxoprolinase/acetone carboxylase beta subunit